MGASIIHSNEPQNFDANIRVLAGPGAGKTYWLVGQIKQILHHSDKLGNCKKVACITYTNKACQNIQLEITFGLDRVEISTIHAFLYANVIKPYFHLIADDLGFNISKLRGHDDTIITNSDFINSVIGKSKKGFIFNKNKVSYQQIGEFISKFRWQYDGKKVHLSQTGRVYKMYGTLDEKFVDTYKHEAWKEKGLMHDDDVLYFSYCLFVRHPKIKQLISARFPYILIDEYQDATSIQHYLLQELGNAGSYITIIGDKAQQIYSFAGANTQFIDNIHLKDICDYTIADNRRSSTSIVKFLNKLRKDISQVAVRNEDFGAPKLIVGPTIDSYEYCFADCGDKKELSALSWTNETVNEIKAHKVPTFKKEKLNQQLLETSDHERSRKFLACVNAVENARRLLMDDAIKSVCKGFGLDKGLMNDRKIAIKYIRILCDKYDEYKDLKALDLLNVIISNIDSSISMVRAGIPKKLFDHPYLDYAKEVDCDEELTDSMTIHKAKGLGFSNVFIAFPDEENALNFLINTNLEAPKDDHRVYYVACSRAKDRLFLSVPTLSETNCQSIRRKFGDLLTVCELSKND